MKHVNLDIDQPSRIELDVRETVRLDRLAPMPDGYVAKQHGALLAPGVTQLQFDQGRYHLRTLNDAQRRGTMASIDKALPAQLLDQATQENRRSKRGETLMKLNRLFIPLTGLALLALASASFATDYKVYPGAGCQPVSGTEARLFVTNPTGITNIGSVDSFVACPVVRDRIPAPAALDPGMRVASANGARLVCAFYSMDQNGAILHEVVQSTTANGPTPLIFSHSGPIRTAAAGSYAFECLLPPSGRVINYSLGEQGETGNAELP